MTTQTQPKTLAGRGAALAGSMIRTTIQALTTPGPDKLEADVERGRAALADAQARVEAAVAAFDADDADDENLDELEAARADVGRCAERSARSLRRLEAARATLAAAARAALIERRDQLLAELTDIAIEAAHAELAQREGEQLCELATTRAARFGVAVQEDRKRGELMRVLEALGESPPYVVMRALIVPSGPVVTVLAKFCAPRHVDDPARREAERLAYALDPRRKPFAYRTRNAAE